MSNKFTSQLYSLSEHLDLRHPFSNNTQHILNQLENLSDSRGVIGYTFNYFHIYNGVSAEHYVQSYMNANHNQNVVNYEQTVLTNIKNYYGQWIQLINMRLNDGSIVYNIKLVDASLVGKMIMMIGQKYGELSHSDKSQSDTQTLIGVARKTLQNQNKPVNQSTMAKMVNSLLTRI